jgi:putative endonuclease
MEKSSKVLGQKYLSKQKVEQFGVARVQSYLSGRGFSILQKGFRSRVGEIDIIASCGDLVCLVEVKARKKANFPISQTVGYSKQRKILSTGKIFASNNGMHSKTFRFDVATVLINPDESFHLEYIENAFCENFIN